MDNFQKKSIKFLIFYAMLCAVITILFHTVWMISYIPSGSMENTIMEGDWVFASRLETGEQDIKRYDILIFIPPDNPDTTYIKRCSCPKFLSQILIFFVTNFREIFPDFRKRKGM